MLAPQLDAPKWRDYPISDIPSAGRGEVSHQQQKVLANQLPPNFWALCRTIRFWAMKIRWKNSCGKHLTSNKNVANTCIFAVPRNRNLFKHCLEKHANQWTSFEKTNKNCSAESDRYLRLSSESICPENPFSFSLWTDHWPGTKSTSAQVMQTRCRHAQASLVCIPQATQAK